MSAPIFPPQGCCVSPCDDPTTVQVPGPQGPAGADGTNGTDGVNAFTTTSANFVQPAVSATVAVTVVDSSWAANGQIVFVATGGYYEVAGIPDSTHLTLENLGYDGNAAPAATITAPQQVSPGGLEGPAGTTPSDTLNDLSPSIQKGDALIDNGANAPNASIVRLAVGTNGKALVADSTQATGLHYSTITPNTAAVDNNVPRFDGTTGTPMPLQDSFLNITDTGAVRASGSGGNARGTSAVDLQVSRTNAANVASGTNSFIGGGIDNRASGVAAVAAGGSGNLATGNVSGIAAGSGNATSNTSAFVGGGDTNAATGAASSVLAGTSNVASGQNSSVSGGTTNTASAQNSSVAGGATNLASGVASHIGGGNSNTASASSSTVPGGIQALADKYGQVAHASGAFVTAGDAQSFELLFRIATTDATANVELFLDGSSARATILNGSTWCFDIITAIRVSDGTSVMIQTQGAIQHIAGTVSLVDTVVQTVIADGSSGSITTANLTVDANNTQKALRIKCTGLGATNIRWLSHCRIVEVNY